MKAHDFINILNDENYLYLEEFFKAEGNSEGNSIDYSYIYKILNLNSPLAPNIYNPKIAKKVNNFKNNLLKLKVIFSEKKEGEFFECSINVFSYIYITYRNFNYKINPDFYSRYQNIKLKGYKLSCFYGIKSKYSIELGVKLYNLFDIESGDKYKIANNIFPYPQEIPFKHSIDEFRTMLNIPNTYSNAQLQDRILIPFQKHIKFFADIYDILVDHKNNIISFQAKLSKDCYLKYKELITLKLNSSINQYSQLENYDNNSALVKLNFDIRNELNNINSFLYNNGLQVTIPFQPVLSFNVNPNDVIKNSIIWITQQPPNYIYYDQNTHTISVNNNNNNNIYYINDLQKVDKEGLIKYKSEMANDPLYQAIFNLFSVFFQQQNQQ